LKPITVTAIAPQATPYRPGLSHSGVVMVIILWKAQKKVSLP
jgi:hypothetical protein